LNSKDENKQKDINKLKQIKSVLKHPDYNLLKSDFEKMENKKDV